MKIIISNTYSQNILKTRKWKKSFHHLFESTDSGVTIFRWHQSVPLSTFSITLISTILFTSFCIYFWRGIEVFLGVVIAKDFAPFSSSILYFFDIEPKPENKEECFDFQSISSTKQIIFNTSIAGCPSWYCWIHTSSVHDQSLYFKTVSSIPIIITVLDHCHLQDFCLFWTF